MLNKILPLAQKMISIKSTYNQPEALEKILELALSNLKEFTIERFECDGVKSSLIFNSKNRPGKFKVILNGHLDIIPGKNYQYQPKIQNNRLYGAGSMDMKANVACLIFAFKDIAKKVDYPLGLQLVTDEEIGGFKGTKYQIDQGVRAEFVIVAEPTNLNIVNKTKGILWLKISSQGTSAHGAYPWRGDNAIWKMKNFLDILEKKFPILKKEQWATSLNLSHIETNNISFNKIPDNCEVWLDIRYIPKEANSILKDIKKILPKEFGLEIVVKEPPLYTDENNQYLKTLKKITEKIVQKKVLVYGAHGSSDARHFTQVKCPAVEFGPKGGGIGSDEEWVDISSLETYYLVIKEFLSSLKP